jgi:hypothetical protein
MVVIIPQIPQAMRHHTWHFGIGASLSRVVIHSSITHATESDSEPRTASARSPLGKLP